MVQLNIVENQNVRKNQTNVVSVLLMVINKMIIANGNLKECLLSFLMQMPLKLMKDVLILKVK